MLRILLGHTDTILDQHPKFELSTPNRKKIENRQSITLKRDSNTKVCIVLVSDPAQGAALLRAPTAERAGVGGGGGGRRSSRVVYCSCSYPSSSGHILHNLIYLAFYLKIPIDVFIIDYMCLNEILYYFISGLLLDITQLYNRSTIIPLPLMIEDTTKKQCNHYALFNNLK